MKEERRERKRFFVVDTRTIIGNDIVFWKWTSSGYTTDLRQALITEDKSEFDRPTDKFIEVDLAWSLSRCVIDHQVLNKGDVHK